MNIKEVLCADESIKDNYDYYEKILQRIVKHENFGSMNPIDIGISCGFPEKDVKSIVGKCCAIVSFEQNGCYFIVKEDEISYLIRFNLKTHEMIKFKKIGGYVNAKIRGDILAWSVTDSKQLHWENIRTGETGRFSIREKVHDFSILEDGFVVICQYQNYASWGEVIKYEYNGKEKHLRVISNYTEGTSIFDHKDKIYVVCSGRVWVVDENSQVISPTEEKADFDCRMMGESKYLSCIEFAEDDVYCYVHYSSGKNIMYGLNGETKNELSRKLDMYAGSYKKSVSRVLTTSRFKFIGHSLLSREDDSIVNFTLPRISDRYGREISQKLSQIKVIDSENKLFAVLGGEMIISLDFKSCVTTRYYSPVIKAGVKNSGVLGRYFL